MSTNIVRTYIDQHGPIVITNSAGKTLTIVAHEDYINDYRIKESTVDDPIQASERDHGFTVYKGGYEHEGFYAFSKDVFDALNNIKLNHDFEYELRKLLPATIAQTEHYRAVKATNNESADLIRIDVRVYGLKDYTFEQTQRGNVIVCPITSTGPTGDGHRIQGYMYADADCTIKFDSIQAWRMRELTREELIAFDPKWGELVTPK